MKVEKLNVFLVGFLLGLLLMFILGFDGSGGKFQASLSNGDLVILDTNTGIANYYSSGQSQPEIIKYSTAGTFRN